MKTIAAILLAIACTFGNTSLPITADNANSASKEQAKKELVEIFSPYIQNWGTDWITEEEAAHIMELGYFTCEYAGSTFTLCDDVWFKPNLSDKYDILSIEIWGKTDWNDPLTGLGEMFFYKLQVVRK